MKITCLGAAREVTGSSCLVEANRVKAGAYTGLLLEVAAHERVRRFRHLGHTVYVMPPYVVRREA
ncbi:MAG: hypothetical protein LDL16_01205 [Thiobacillus sp.]|nr:hypothetical protein [Thiobacillus sp.]